MRWKRRFGRNTSGELPATVGRPAEEQGQWESEVLDDAGRYFLRSYAYLTKISVRCEADLESVRH